MILALDNGFPKSARLLKTRDFTFRDYRRVQTDQFSFVYSTAGAGRLGISISKKNVRRATARNRIRRLLKEVFRHHRGELSGVDVHVVGKSTLGPVWTELKKSDIESQFAHFVSRLPRGIIGCGNAER